MYLAKVTEMVCCTCRHWTGMQIFEEDGFVYSLKKLEGVCNSVKRRERRVGDDETSRAMTFPYTHCDAWQKWREAEIETGK